MSIYALKRLNLSKHLIVSAFEGCLILQNELLVNLTVSESTKEWVRRIVELDEIQDRIQAQIKEATGSEATASNIMEKRFEAFADIRKGLLIQLSQNIYENITDICSTQI